MFVADTRPNQTICSSRTRHVTLPRCIRGLGRPQPPRVNCSHHDTMQQCATPQQGPFVLGLTGSIGMGKSTVASFFQDCGAPVLDADAVVHALYSKGGAAVSPVGAAFPAAVQDGAISRPALSRCVVGNNAAMARLESIVHPLVAQERLCFMQEMAAEGYQLVVLDIPLLYETGAERHVDAVAVVSAPPHMQRQRVLSRPGMTADKFEAILARQVPDEVKRQRADYVINTGCSLQDTQTQVDRLVRELEGQQGNAHSLALRGVHH